MLLDFCHGLPMDHFVNVGDATCASALTQLPQQSLSRRSVVGGLGLLMSGVVFGDAVWGFSGPSAIAAPDFTIVNHWAAFPITADWSAHLARGSLGGIDFGMDVGTPLCAPISGSLTLLVNEYFGRYARIENSSNHTSVMAHLTSFNGGNRTVEIGDVVGFSGGDPSDPYAGDSTGPHLHWHMVDSAGNRYDPLPYTSGTTGEIMPYFSRKQLAGGNISVSTLYARLPYSLSPLAEDIAAGAGGGGYYDLTGAFYVSGLESTEVLELVAVIQNATTGTESPSYTYAFPGHASGTVKLQAQWRFNVVAPARVFVKARTSAGNAVINTWGVDIVNYQS